MDSLQPEEVKRSLRTRILGREIFHFEELGSTNDTAKELVKKSAPEGTVVVAETQFAGRGRTGRRWFSPRGGIWFSVVLKPEVDLSEVTPLTLMVGVAVARAIKKHTKLEARLKWPNDVTVDGKKVCGLLAEAVRTGLRYDVLVGVGVNANVDMKSFPPELRSKAISLREKLGKDVNRAELTSVILEEMEKLYVSYMESEQGRHLIISEWKKLSGILNAKVKITVHDQTVEGLAVDVNGNGALLLRLNDGSTKKFFSGDVSMVEKL